MMYLTSDIWRAMTPAIEKIDGGCPTCIKYFIANLAEELYISDDMITMISTNDKPLNPKEVRTLIENLAWIETNG